MSQRRRSRYSRTDRLEGATEFSRTPELRDGLFLIWLIKRTAWLDRALRAATDLDRGFGRPQAPGRWDLAYIGFCISDSVDIQPWVARTSEDFWRECGFEPVRDRDGVLIRPAKPPYSRVYDRFRALEQHALTVHEVAGLAIRHAMRHDPLIGCHIHVDSTEAESHAALIHDCDPAAPCMRKRRRARSGEALRPKRVSTDDHKESRQAEAAGDVTDENPMGDVDECVVDERGIRVLVGGHWYRCRDISAGPRAYTGERGAKRFWVGFYNQKLIDHRTGAPLAVYVDAADVCEYDIYPKAYELLERNTGLAPQTMVADRGFSVEKVFAHNSTRGIASVVMPWRNSGGHGRHDKETHDRHGVVRCKHCGGPTIHVRFSANAGKPRLWVDCALGRAGQGHTDGCTKTQTISCAADWRLLVPLPRTDPLYHELMRSHDEYENTHNLWRLRYRVGADDLGLRPKRIGAAWQQQRASFALLAEWMLILYREGWLGSARRNNPRKAAIEQTRRAAAARRLTARLTVENLRVRRAQAGLLVPYGKAAERLGVGQAIPPSRRDEPQS
jgi:hypothetical protein